MAGEMTVCVVDDDDDVRDSLEILLTRRYRVRTFDSAKAFLDAGIKAGNVCVLADIRMPEMDGLALQREINRTIPGLPVIIMTGHGDVPMAVQAMKEGAVEFLEKPFERTLLLGAIESAFERLKTVPLVASGGEASARKALTEREKDVFDLLVEGHQNKVIAHKLGISTRTVEVHRARVMDKLGARSLADLVRLSLGAART
ncbi:MAG TPA: response regulator [Rhizomicrobium sp.]|nr:response regulator [Rhizomicrobium sp.]